MDKFEKTQNVGKKIGAIRAEFNQFVPNLEFPDEERAKKCVDLAITAAESGNFGAGCVIVDSQGRIVAEGRNSVFGTHFSSGAHAEMVAIDEFEKKYPNRSMRDCALYASLEPCPMCTTRVITAGAGKVRYVADDPLGGMARLRDTLPGEWPGLAAAQDWAKADCSPTLQEIAWQAFTCNALELNQKLKKR